MRRLPAVGMFYAGEVWLSLGLETSFTVSAVYFVNTVNLDPLQLVLVGTVMELSIFIFEVPTGVVADTYSRRLSLVIGWLLMGAGLVVIGAVPEFAVILVGYALWGLGYTFTSGAHQAWITDEVGADHVGRIFARGQQLAYAGGLVGVGVSVAVASWDLASAVILGGIIVAGFGVFSALFMPETGFTRAPAAERAGALREMRTTAGRGARYVRMQPMLLLVVGIAFFAGASSESFDRLWQAHLIRDVGLPGIGALNPVVWFGILGAVTMVIGLIASQVLVRRFERVGQARLTKLLTVFTSVQVVAVVVFALAGNFALAVLGMWLYYLTRSLINPVYQTWLNEQITDSRVRATVISITSQSDAIGEVAGGPAVGALGRATSLPIAMLAGGALLAPALALYGRAMRHGGVEPELAELPPDVEGQPSP